MFIWPHLTPRSFKVILTKHYFIYIKMNISMSRIVIYNEKSSFDPIWPQGHLRSFGQNAMLHIKISISMSGIWIFNEKRSFEPIWPQGHLRSFWQNTMSYIKMIISVSRIRIFNEENSFDLILTPRSFKVILTKYFVTYQNGP